MDHFGNVNPMSRAPLQVDLGGVHTVVGIVVRPRPCCEAHSPLSNQYPRKLTVSYRSEEGDGEAQVDGGTGFGLWRSQAPLKTGSAEVRFAVPVRARFVKVHPVDRGPGGMGMRLGVLVCDT